MNNEGFACRLLARRRSSLGPQKVQQRGQSPHGLYFSPVAITSNCAVRFAATTSNLESRAPMNVLFVTSEHAGLAKAGGLGDVAAGLPPALCRLGIDVRVLLPAYRAVLAQLPEVAWIGRLPGHAGHAGLPHRRGAAAERRNALSGRRAVAVRSRRHALLHAGRPRLAGQPSALRPAVACRGGNRAWPRTAGLVARPASRARLAGRAGAGLPALETAPNCPR